MLIANLGAVVGLAAGLGVALGTVPVGKASEPVFILATVRVFLHLLLLYFLIKDSKAVFDFADLASEVGL
ncbi:hypothetical protein CVD28_25730 [Bacillus sp. M6-12]|uniref:hypothetical protein n=1 Tax=Bacillus sp. M6-12 TaxID=2054166 RepID=UPI000C794473|nr:hypothetical protein [Bacillus sp. M6-12]PLS14921.1 hypothetical protein CVD28_25730 [Bacillus sp. M6-12]